jgi:hypothetical protein
LTRKFCKQSGKAGQKTPLLLAGKEVIDMALYTIIRVYEIPAENQQQAAERMLEALVLRVEKDYHVKDIIREPDAKPGQGHEVRLYPPAGWLSLVIKQLTGK